MYRIMLNILYGSLLLWMFIYIGGQYILILSPFTIAYSYIYPYGAIALAIILFFAGKKWKSEERIAAGLFLLPDKITVHGYWGETLLLKANFIRDNNQYKIVQPYPSLSLIGFENRWYIQYNLHGKDEKIFLKDNLGASSEIRLDEMID